jgi:4-amino-4-deoxy-L-arabinose transferase-like glycosyltransferase
MPHPPPKPFPWRDVAILAGLWAIAAVGARLWIGLDQAPPAWDQGDHLTRALNHWWVLQDPQWLSAGWWRTLWQQAPSQRGPLVALVTVPWFALWGASLDVGLIANLVFSAVLLGSLYVTGRQLFSPAVGLWAAGLALVAPLLVYLRLEYLLDYGLTATVAFLLAALTGWWTATSRRGQWLWTALWGLGVALALLTRTSALLFLVALLGWALALVLWGRRWERLGQWVAGLGLGLLLLWPWFSTSWLTIISTTFESNAHGTIYMDVPQANTLAGWLFYPRQLPAMVSSPVLFTALALGLLGLGDWLRRGKGRSQPPSPYPPPSAWLWLGGIVVAILVLGALGTNKQPRLLAPLLAPLLVALAALLRGRGPQPWAGLRWLAVGVAAVLALWTVFPLPGAPLGRTSFVFMPYRGTPWPHSQIVAAMAEATPHLTGTLGVAMNTPQLNPANLDFAGGAADFQVFARQLAWNPATALLDAQALDWYLTKTGDQGVFESEERKTGQALLKEAIATAPDLVVQATWPLPDGSEAQLYRRQPPQVAVAAADRPLTQVQISAVEAPEAVVAGRVYPITYRLAGPWDDLKQGLLLLSWRPESGPDSGPDSGAAPVWISDHAVGLGRLYEPPRGDRPPAPSTSYTVEERLAIAPPADLPPGRYTLQAELFNPDRGTSYAVALPPTAIAVQAPESLPETSAPAPGPTAPPLDLSTYLRQLSAGLAQGQIDPIFAEVSRINQYDPRQSYLQHTEQALGYRLQQTPDRLDWLYGKAIAEVLQQKADAAIATLGQIATVAPDNPYHWAYLGFVHLYAWHPRRAQAALDQAAALDPNLPNLRLLQAAAAIMQLRLPRAIDLLRAEGVL